jgi:hypothetical protein
MTSVLRQQNWGEFSSQNVVHVLNISPENRFPSMLYLLVKIGNCITFAEWPQLLARYTISALPIRWLLLVQIHALSALH